MIRRSALLLVPAALAAALASPASAGPECDSPSRPHVHVGVNCNSDGAGWCGVYLATPVHEACPIGPIEID